MNHPFAAQAVNLNDDLAIAQFLRAGAGESLDRRRGPAKFDPITLAVERRRPLLADTLLTNATLVHQRKNGRYVVPRISDSRTIDQRRAGQRGSTAYEDFRNNDHINRSQSSALDDVKLFCCECGSEEAVDGAHYRAHYRDSLVDDEVAPPPDPP